MQVYRFPVDGMEAGSTRAEIDLGQLLSPLNASQGLSLREPGPRLSQLKVPSEDALHGRVQPEVVKLPPPLSQNPLACRSMMIRLRDRNRRLFKRTHRVRATARDYEQKQQRKRHYPSEMRSLENGLLSYHEQDELSPSAAILSFYYTYNPGFASGAAGRAVRNRLAGPLHCLFLGDLIGDEVQPAIAGEVRE